MRLPKPQTVEVTLLHNKLDGLTILHLSDLHINVKTSVQDIEALIQQCQKLSYDFAVVTGDIIDCKVSKIHAQLQHLNALQKCYYISGNHDLVYGLKELNKILTNWTFLDNSHTFIDYKKERVLLAGISDRFSKFFSHKREEHTIKTILEQHCNTILLAHQPKDYKLAVKTDTNLFLCGHTHGGQIYPFHYFVRLFQPFLNGLFYKEKTAIYVNKGLGTWGIDFRFKAQSEITLLKLTSKSVQYPKGRE